MVSSIAGAGAYAGCSYCCLQGEYSNALDKMVYLQHRAFLPRVDELHSDHNMFPSKTSPESLPAPKTMNYVDAANTRLCAVSSSSEKKELLQETGCKGSYSLRKLPFHDRYLNTPEEPMHLVKNMAEHIVKLLSGVSDTKKV